MAKRPTAKLRIEHWATDRLKEYANNPRLNDDAVPQMVEAIKEFGFRIPIIIKSDGEVCDGHLRLKAARAMGLKTVPVTFADDLTEAQIREFRLVANHSATWAKWDVEALNAEFDQLEAVGIDLDRFGLADIAMPDLEEVDAAPAPPRAPRKSTTIFVTVPNADAERARKAIATALDKLKISHGL